MGVRARFLVATVVPALALALVVALAVAFGASDVSLARALSDPSSLDRTIVLSARLPRVALAAIAGAGLATVGVAFQALLRNPLAEPFVLGVSGGAAVGATLAIVLGLASLGVLVVPLAALAGGLLATALVYTIARARGVVSGTDILLAGVIVNAMASAAVTFLKTLVGASKAQELLFWLMGFLDVPSPKALASVALYVGVGCAALWLDAARLNLLALGEEPAAHLGVDVPALERRVFFVSSMVVGAIVSVTGLIGFVGLVVPHVARKLVGGDLRVLFPACTLGGAAALVLCDLVARASFLWLGTEPPVGAVTALVGGPLFLALFRRRVA